MTDFGTREGQIVYKQHLNWTLGEYTKKHEDTQTKNKERKDERRKIKTIQTKIFEEHTEKKQHYLPIFSLVSSISCKQKKKMCFRKQ